MSSTNNHGNNQEIIFHAPSTLKEALQLLTSDPSLEIIAGGTDLWPKWSMSKTRPTRLLSLHRLAELKNIEETNGQLRLGAMCTHASLAESPLVKKACPSLATAAATVGARQIQNRGTLGGNVVNASPAADLPPPLLAADAQVELSSLQGTRTVALVDFYQSYRQTARKPDELLTAVLIPALPKNGREYFRKIGTRRAQAISKVVGSMRLIVGEDGKISRAGLAFGSVAPISLRLSSVEKWLIGRPLDAQTAKEAGRLAGEDVTPIDDLRSTAAYRRHVVERLISSWLS